MRIKAAPAAALLAAVALVASTADAFRNPCSCETSAVSCRPSLPIERRPINASTLTLVRTLFPETRRIDPRLQEAAVDPNLHLTQRANVTVCFVHEGAGYRNQLGVYQFDRSATQFQPRNLTLLFPDVSYHSPGCMESGDCVTVGPFESGTSIGFYLEQDGYSARSAGRVPTRFFSDMNNSVNVDRQRHAVNVFVPNAGLFLTGFEDLTNLGDADYNDVMFTTIVTPLENPNVRPVDLNDGVSVDGDQFQFCPAGARSVNRTVRVGGVRYALLDNNSPEDVLLGCQFSRLRVPSGWQLVPPEQHHLAAVSSFRWGAQCVVLSDGFGYNPSTGQRCPGSQFLSNFGVNCSGVARCARILIMDTTSVRDFDDCIPNRDLTGLDGALLASWQPYGNGYTVAQGCRDGAGSSIRVRGTAGTTSRGNGAQVRIAGSSAAASGIVVGAWSRPSSMGVVSGAAEVEYAIYMDVYFTTGLPQFGVKVQFQPSLSSWHYREAVFLPQAGRTVDYINLYLLLRGVSGSADFCGVTVRPAARNLLQNPSFAERTSFTNQNDARYWFHMLPPSSSNPTPRTYALDSSAFPAEDQNGGSVCCNSLAANGLCGAQQFVVFSAAQQAAQDFNAVLVSGCSLHQSSGPARAQGADYSIYLDILFADGTFEYSRVVPFTYNAGEWQCQSSVFPIRKTVRQFTLAAMHRANPSAVSRVCFDNVALVPLNRSSSFEGISYGDPHFSTFDSEKFDVMAVGEFVLAQDQVLSVQVRHAQAGPIASVNSAVAVRYSKTTLMLERASALAAPRLVINGADVIAGLGDQVPLLGDEVYDGGMLHITGTLGDEGEPLTYTMTWPTMHRVEAQVFVSADGVQFFHVRVEMPESSKGTTTGILGNSDGDSGNEPNSGAGRRLRRLLSDDVEALRVDSNSSAFTYAEGQSTATFVDPNFRPDTQNLARTFTQTQISAAQAACSSSIGSPQQVRACVIDVLSLGTSSVVGGHRLVQANMAFSQRTELLNVDYGQLSGSAALAASLALSAVVAALTLVARL